MGRTVAKPLAWQEKAGSKHPDLFLLASAGSPAGNFPRPNPTQIQSGTPEMQSVEVTTKGIEQDGEQWMISQSNWRLTGTEWKLF